MQRPKQFQKHSPQEQLKFVGFKNKKKGYREGLRGDGINTGEVGKQSHLNH